MHELSIAHELVALACASAERAGARRVRTVHVRVGALAGVAGDALALGYEVAASDTPLAGAQLIIEAVPATIHCGACGRDVELAGVQALACPHCGSNDVQWIRGQELELATLEVETA
jgi:hydrogenase nickel incorporation protein HypA/HybF